MSLYADVCWQFSCCDERERKRRVLLHFPCEIALQRRSTFSLWFAFMHVPRDTGFTQYFDEVDYLNIVRILDAKVIASSFPATVLNA